MNLLDKYGLLRPWIFSFAVGSFIELFMLKARIGKETFYETVLRKENQRRKERIFYQYDLFFPRDKDADRNV